MTPEERQEKFNDRITAAIEKITEAVSDLEKHTVKVDAMQDDVKDHETRLRHVETGMDFVKSAKRVFSALIVALAVASSTAVWQAVNGSESITKEDIKNILAASKSAK